MSWLAGQVQYEKTYNSIINTELRKFNGDPDILSGVGITGILLPEYSRSKQMIQFAKDEFQWFMDNAILDDGGIPETPRYNASEFKSFVQLAYALKRYDNSNIFSNSDFKNMFTDFFQLQTPNDPINECKGATGKVLQPAIGDAGWENFGIPYMGMVMRGLYDYSGDTTLAKNVAKLWEDSDKPMAGESNGGALLANFVLIDSSVSSEAPSLSSTTLEDTGYVIFRDDVGTNDHYMIMRACENYISHFHYDAGSFSIYGLGVPMSLDPGVYNYGNSLSYWYATAKAHNSVVFKNGTTYYTGPLTGTIDDFYSSSAFDFVKTSLPWPQTTRNERNMAFVKGDFDVYVLWDSIDSTYESEQWMHYLASDLSVSGGNRVTATCYNSKVLDQTYLLPASPSIDVSDKGGSGWYYSSTFNNEQKISKVAAGAGNDYLSVIYPRASTDDPLSTSTVTDDKSDAYTYKVTKTGTGWFIILINNGSAQDVTLSGQTTDLKDIRTGTNYQLSGSDVTVSMPANGIKILIENVE